jgi:hypothetical protein
MSAPTPKGRLGQGRIGEWRVLALAGLASLAPYVVFHAQFARLFWFGDEFDLIDQFDRMGFWKWVWLVFAENFVPVFKVLWGGAVFAFGGSYGGMMALVWLTHAVNVALLGRLMRTCGLSWISVFLAQAVFGLAVVNFETLGWSVQGSAILSVTCLLAALDGLFRSEGVTGPLAWATASALTFSRGVLTGPLAALGRFLLGTGEAPAVRLRRAAPFLVPAVVVGALISLLAAGNHKHMAGHVGEAAVYGLWYFGLNPVHRLFAVESWGWRTTALLGLAKILVIAWSLREARGKARILFILLLAFDLGNAVLLGIGRYHTGIQTTVASRYQYASLLALMPIAGFWADELSRRGRPATTIRQALWTVVLLILSVHLVRAWPGELEGFTTWRGSDSRRILFVEASPDPHGVPGIPFLPMARAKELIAKYHLH